MCRAVESIVLFKMFCEGKRDKRDARAYRFTVVLRQNQTSCVQPFLSTSPPKAGWRQGGSWNCQEGSEGSFKNKLSDILCRPLLLHTRDVIVIVEDQDTCREILGSPWTAVLSENACNTSCFFCFLARLSLKPLLSRSFICFLFYHFLVCSFSSLLPEGLFVALTL